MLDQYVTENFPTKIAPLQAWPIMLADAYVGLSGEVVRRSWASFQGQGDQHFTRSVLGGGLIIEVRDPVAKEGKKLDPDVEDKRAATQFLWFF